MLNLTDILDAARTPRTIDPCPTCGESRVPCPCAAREAVRLLCEGLTDAQLRAEIESIQRVIDHPRDRSTLLDARAARAALETDRDRRRKNLSAKP